MASLSLSDTQGQDNTEQNFCKSNFNLSELKYIPLEFHGGIVAILLSTLNTDFYNCLTASHFCPDSGKSDGVVKKNKV